MLSGRRGRILALGCVAGAGVYLYRSGALHSAADRAKRTVDLLRLYLQALQTGGEITAGVLRDLQAFLSSEEDEVPPSLRQLAKLAASAEASRCLATAVEGTLRGAAAATGAEPRAARKLHDSPSSSSFPGDSPPALGVADRFLELLFSERGHSLVTVAISMAAKSAAEAATQVVEAYNASSKVPLPEGADPRQAARQQMDDLVSAATQGVLGFMTDPAGHKALSSLIATFVSVSVGTYVDKTKGMNFYEDLVASVASPDNRRAVEAISSTVTREAIEAIFTFSRSPSDRWATGPAQPSHAQADAAQRCESAPLLPITRILDFAEAEQEAKSDEEGAGEGIPASTSAAARRRLSAAGIRPPPPTPLEGDADADAPHHQKLRPPHPQHQQGGGLSSAAVVGDVLSQVVHAVSNAEGRRLVCDVAGSVTSEAVHATVASFMEAAGFRAARQHKAPGGARVTELGDGSGAEALGGDLALAGSSEVSPGLYVAIFACLAVQILLLVQQYSGFAG